MALRVAKDGQRAAKAVKEPLQVRIPGAVKRRFKVHAAMHGVEPNELFVEVWEHYERTHAVDVSGQGKRDGQHEQD
jgi:uncharacterized protein YndB with AHSA1/START domain